MRSYRVEPTLVLLTVSVLAAALQNQCKELVSVEDFHDYFRRTVSVKAVRYIDSVAGNGDTYKWNLESFRKLRFNPKYLVDVSKRNLRTTILGQAINVPFGASPSAAHKNAHRDGELATARACSAVGAPMILSDFSTIPLEDVAKAGGPNLVYWQQVEFFTQRHVTLDIVRRAQKSGAKTVVLTIDIPVLGLRFDTMKDSYFYPKGERYENFVKYNLSEPDDDPSATWKEVDWLRSKTNLPIVVKGVLSVEDALLALEHGAKAIIVSNQGGRQLDGSPASIDVLSEVVQAVAGRAEVYLDSGVRTGMDILKALAQGARAVFLGRPIHYGLSYQGEKGVKCVLNLLKNELENVMALTVFEMTYTKGDCNQEMYPSYVKLMSEGYVPISHKDELG